MPEPSRRRRYLILAICCMSLLIVGLDNTVVNVALPYQHVHRPGRAGRGHRHLGRRDRDQHGPGPGGRRGPGDSGGLAGIFWVNVPIGLAALALTGLFVPESRAARARRIDPVGQVLVIIILGTIICKLGIRWPCPCKRQP